MRETSLLNLLGRGARRLALAAAALAPALSQAQTAPTVIRLEAEDAILKGLTRQTATPGYAGAGYVGEFENSTDSLIFRFPAQASRYALTIRYTSPTAAKKTNVEVNGTSTERTLTATGAAFGTLAAGNYVLQAAANTISIDAGQGYFGIDYIELTPIETRLAPLVNGRAEAEDGLLSGTSVATAPAGFSGTGFVTGFDNSDAKNVAITFNNPTAGLYQLTVGHTSPFGFKMANVTVNEAKSAVSFPGTTAAANFATADAGKVLLPQGLNTVIIGGGYGYYGIDYIQLTPVTVALPAKPAKQLIDPQATPEARALMSYLVDLYGSKTLSGQQDDQYGRNGSEISYVLATTGKEPALASMDLYDYTAAPVAQYGQPNGTTERYLAWATSGNGRGITSLIWHWRSPTDLKTATDPSGAFYTDRTNFNLAAVLADKTGARYQALLNDIDLIAVQLLKFQAAGIPVLWRPLHEAAGGFFWWGRDKNPEPFKELWRLMHERLTNRHQLHNLIWVYSVTDNQSLAWYPGDEYADITGHDVYGPDRTASLSSYWEGQQTLFGGRKLAALTETGNPPDPSLLNAYATWWSWFCSWQGEFVRRQPAAYLRRVYNDANILTKDELADWKTLALATKTGAAATDAGFSAFPNPARGYTLNVRLRLPAAQLTQVELVNTLGQRVKTMRPRLLAGTNEFQVPLAGVAPGVYQLVVRPAGRPALSQRVVVAP
ncbi:glycosyl hydrolase [uncultured Hymenobacter sp.]|uniref:glycosyl hydrolase n=1 Tax=uncultured Hymenobacter sp. TaxID=170016 RepID=UPI0035CB76E4